VVRKNALAPAIRANATRRKKEFIFCSSTNTVDSRFAAVAIYIHPEFEKALCRIFG
jgi:hypothetical protein